MLTPVLPLRLLSPRPSLLTPTSDTRTNASPQKPLDLKQLKQRAAAIPPIVSARPSRTPGLLQGTSPGRQWRRLGAQLRAGAAGGSTCSLPVSGSLVPGEIPRERRWERRPGCGGAGSWRAAGLPSALPAGAAAHSLPTCALPPRLLPSSPRPGRSGDPLLSQPLGQKGGALPVLMERPREEALGCAGSPSEESSHRNGPASTEAAPL